MQLPDTNKYGVASAGDEDVMFLVYCDAIIRSFADTHKRCGEILEGVSLIGIVW